MATNEDARPAYVRRMAAEIAADKAELGALEVGLQELVNYLHTPKFAPPNNYVNRDDVLMRIRETQAAALQARGSAPPRRRPSVP